MVAGIAYLGGHEFRVEQTLIDATSILKPDVHWQFTDSHGHEHKWVDGKVPTIHLVKTGEYWCDDCHDMHDETSLQCTECGDEVNPRQVANDTKQYVRGLKTLYVDGQQVTPDEFKAKWVEAGGPPIDL